MPKIYQTKHYPQPRRGTGFTWIHPRTGKRTECGGLEFYVDFRDEAGRRQRRKAHDGVCTCAPRQRGVCPHEQIAIDLVRQLQAGPPSEPTPVPIHIVEPAPNPIVPLGAFIDRYLAELDASRRHQPKTKQNKELSIRVFRVFCERKGVLDLRGITRAHVEAFRDELGKKTINRGSGKNKKEGRWKANTINRYVRDIRAMFNKAIRWELTEKNPARSLGQGDDLFIPETDAKDITVLTDEELKLLFSLHPDVVKKLFPKNYLVILDMLLLFYRCGLRLGELCHLTFRQIRGGVLHIEPHDGWIPKWGVIRAVPIDSAAKEMLDRRRAENPKAKYVFETSEKTRFNELNVGPDFSRLFKEFDIVGDTGSGVSTHCLRHTFCTTCLTSGVPITTVKDWMGHTEIEMTMRYYHKIAALTDTHMATVNFVKT